MITFDLEISSQIVMDLFAAMRRAHSDGCIGEYSGKVIEREGQQLTLRIAASSVEDAVLIRMMTE